MMRGGRWWAMGLLLGAWIPGWGQGDLRSVYLGEVGVREATGRNDGARVGEYLASCGLDEGHAWCGAFVAWCHLRAGLPVPPGAAWSPSWFATDRLVVGEYRGGDVFGIYYRSLGRVGHVGFIDSVSGDWALTVEGNTDPSGGRDGGGVHRRRRLVRSFRHVSRWR